MGENSHPAVDWQRQRRNLMSALSCAIGLAEQAHLDDVDRAFLQKCRLTLSVAMANPPAGDRPDAMTMAEVGS